MREPRKTVLPDPFALCELVGQQLGVSPPRSVSQADVDGFADVTGDHQWIHVDVERARSGPFGGTIVHGFLTVALVPVLLSEIFEVTEHTMGVNYGLDRVRFVRPLTPGTPIQGVATLVSAERLAERSDGAAAGVQAKASVAIEFAADGQTCCIAEVLFRYYL